MTAVDFRNAQTVYAIGPDGNLPLRGVLALADGSVCVVQRSKDPQKPEILFGPVTEAAAETLAVEIIDGNARAITDPLSLGTMAAAYLGFIRTGRIPSASGSAASSGSEGPVPPAEGASSSPAAPTLSGDASRTEPVLGLAEGKTRGLDDASPSTCEVKR